MSLLDRIFGKRPLPQQSSTPAPPIQQKRPPAQAGGKGTTPEIKTPPVAANPPPAGPGQTQKPVEALALVLASFSGERDLAIQLFDAITSSNEPPPPYPFDLVVAEGPNIYKTQMICFFDSSKGTPRPPDGSIERECLPWLERAADGDWWHEKETHGPKIYPPGTVLRPEGYFGGIQILRQKRIEAKPSVQDNRELKKQIDASKDQGTSAAMISDVQIDCALPKVVARLGEWRVDELVEAMWFYIWKNAIHDPVFIKRTAFTTDPSRPTVAFIISGPVDQLPRTEQQVRSLWDELVKTIDGGALHSFLIDYREGRYGADPRGSLQRQLPARIRPRGE